MSQLAAPIAIKSENFSVAFKQMCNFVAIADSTDSAATVEKLIQQCFVLRPDDIFTNADDFMKAVSQRLGIELPEGAVRSGLDTLQKAKNISFAAGRYHFSDTQRAVLRQSIEDAIALEDRVKVGWWETLAAGNKDLDVAWAVLQSYLAEIFRRHGLRAIRLLELSPQSTDANEEQSVTILLNDAVRKHAPVGRNEIYSETVQGFLRGINGSKDRVSYIAQLADAAYNYFSLMVPPEVASSFRKRLESLTLFLDTNFLFGVLDINLRSKLVSENLVAAINDSKLPFKLRYHQATDKELRKTIGYQAERLRQRTWPRHLSQAAANNGTFEGLELRYHQRNAEVGVDVSSFLDPYEHPDVLLKELNIDVHRVQLERTQEAKAIEFEYQAYLEEKGKSKPSETTRHDSIVLSAAHDLRSKAASSLAAGSLMVTFDYTLYRFDQQLSRERHIKPCAVLPEAFLQVLRPYLPSKHDYDEAFAQTFSTTEFRTMGGNREEAASKLLYVMASYSRFPEEAAAKILSNKPLLEGVSSDTTEDELKYIVENQLTEQNNLLAEENKELRRKTEQAELRDAENRQVIEAKDQQIDLQTQTASQLEKRLTATEREHQKLHTDVGSWTKAYHRLQTQRVETSQKLEAARDAKANLQGDIQSLAGRRERAVYFFTGVGLVVAFVAAWLLRPVIPDAIKTFLRSTLIWMGLGGVTVAVAVYFIARMSVGMYFDHIARSKGIELDKLGRNIENLQGELTSVDSQISDLIAASASTS